MFRNQKYKTFIILQDNVICGYITLSQYKDREAYDRTAKVSIFLKPDCTGAGIGSRAVKFIEEYAATQGIHVLIASISGENSRSIKLFEKSGYEKCAHYKEIGKKFGRLLDVVAFQKKI